MTSDNKKLDAAQNILEHLGKKLDANISVRLWDGRMIPLGSDVQPGYFLSINNPDSFTSILRKPTMETILLNYASRDIDFHGGDIYEFAEVAREKHSKIKFKSLDKALLVKNILPLLFSSSKTPSVENIYDEDETGRKVARKNKDFIKFHYDVSNEFYSLFLDKEMLYSCGYFTDWNNSLDQAQFDKLDMICKKLQLKKGDRFLDIGCGWGALICHAAKYYGAQAHGVTLSENQFQYAQEKIKKLGLSDLVKVELKDYAELEGEYDKISSIGMYEHVGIANYPFYFNKVKSLLRDRGIFLNHGIVRRAKSSAKKFKKIKPTRRMILKYIFPGSELDHIGHSTQALELSGFEVHDIETWREHYGLTTKHWCKRLIQNKEEAIRIVGEERYRMWIAYLVGVSLGFKDGTMRIYQTVSTKYQSKGLSGMPLTREHLYQESEATKKVANN